MKVALLISLALSFACDKVQAQSTIDPNLIEAKKIVERLSGTKVPMDHPLVIEAASALRAGNRLGAAQAATKHPNFLNVTVKMMGLKMSTRDETIRLLLNDFAASVIGVVRDGTDARELLTGDFYYAGDPTKYSALMGKDNISEDKVEFVKNNDHYTNLEHPPIDIGSILVRRSGQKTLGRMASSGDEYLASNPDPAGVLTSTTFLREHATAGTNRRLVEYTMREFMCAPLEQWADASGTDAWVGRDVDRFPGGDHNKFLISCKACHSVMDSLRGAFAKWDFDNGPLHSSTRPGDGRFDDKTGVVRKMTKNATVFPGGYVIKSEAFINNARNPADEALFGWRGPAAVGGAGVNGLGRAVANSQRFSQCMAKRVYDSVCRTNLDMKTEMGVIKPLADYFESRNYNLKELFQQVTVLPSCLGEK